MATECNNEDNVGCENFTSLIYFSGTNNAFPNVTYDYSA